MKSCSKCKEVKEFNEFYRNHNTKSGYASWCKQCNRDDQNSKYDKEKTMTTGLWTRFRMRLTDYNELLEKQNFSCAVCKRHQSEFTRNFAVDHDHNCCPGNRACGNCNRGLLCVNCNTSLGNVKDDVTILKAMIAYLEGGAS